MRFDEFDLNDSLQEGIEAIGYEEATPIQIEAIPHILEGRDIIATAQTGTGKTAAYLLPVLHRIEAQRKSKPYINTLILTPTRELALQVDQQLQGFAYFTSCTSSTVYGGGTGSAWERERNALKSGADIIIATPGKLLSFMRQKIGDFSQLQHFILDEADRMLDMGFQLDISEISSYVQQDRQNLLFSATFPKKIQELAKKILNNPVEINIANSKPAEGVVQAAFLIHDRNKVELIKYLLRDDDVPSVIIFASTKRAVKEIAKTLLSQDLKVGEIHSDLEQAEREETLRKFRNRQFTVLVATDIISRGIDIESISMVINYDVPSDAEDYVHRVGRTARAESTGEAVTFVNEYDQYNFWQIEEKIGREIRKVPLPSHIESGLEYDPKKRRGGGGGGGRGKGRGRKPGGKGGGGRARKSR